MHSGKDLFNPIGFFLLALFVLSVRPAAAYDEAQYIKDELVFGASGAPVSVRKIYSLTCPSCAKADENVVEPLMESDLFKGGKVKLILDPFPLDGVAALEQQMVSCIQNPDRALSLMKVFYRGQEAIHKAGAPMVYIRKLMSGWGMDREAVDECMAMGGIRCSFSGSRTRLTYERCIMGNFREVYSYWTKRREFVQKRFVPIGFQSSTPTFLVNGRVVLVYDWDDLKELIEDSMGVRNVR